MSSSSSRDVNEEKDSARYVKLTDFWLSNFMTVELWIRVIQVGTAEKPLRNVNTEHRDACFTCFSEEKYQIGYGMN